MCSLDLSIIIIIYNIHTGGIRIYAHQIYLYILVYILFECIYIFFIYVRYYTFTYVRPTRASSKEYGEKNSNNNNLKQRLFARLLLNPARAFTHNCGDEYSRISFTYYTATKRSQRNSYTHSIKKVNIIVSRLDFFVFVFLNNRRLVNRIVSGLSWVLFCFVF